jgi:cobyrinic acid a,c-diamide synthase
MQPIVIAAPSSGCGKTTVTLALLAALRRRGLAVAPFKVGPDFIDPGHHAAVCGCPSRNLDGWVCGESGVRETFGRGCAGAEVAVVEGVMGLFDGAAGDSDAGSTAEIARWLGGRILLVVDARSQARSAAALVQGFSRFDPRLGFAGVIFNRVGSARHAELLRDALASVPGLPPLLGCLPREEELALPERHLGLVTAGETPPDDAFYERLADWLERHVDLDSLVGRRGQVLTFDKPVQCQDLTPKVRIAVARDAAFCFCYPENLELLQAAGAEIIPFSPLGDRSLPPGIDGLYLPGGYPELYAECLAKNDGLLQEIRSMATDGLPVYAECGGFVYLARGIVGAGLVPAQSGHPQGVPLQEFVGLFPAVARMLPQRKALGYREVTFSRDTILGPAGTVARGHEFHYSEIVMPPGIARVYHLRRADGTVLEEEGFVSGNVLGSYVHLHFGSNPQVAIHFVEYCRNRKA